MKIWYTVAITKHLCMCRHAHTAIQIYWENIILYTHGYIVLFVHAHSTLNRSWNPTINSCYTNRYIEFLNTENMHWIRFTSKWIYNLNIKPQIFDSPLTASIYRPTGNYLWNIGWHQNIMAIKVINFAFARSSIHHKSIRHNGVIWLPFLCGVATKQYIVNMYFTALVFYEVSSSALIYLEAVTIYGILGV